MQHIFIRSAVAVYFFGTCLGIGFAQTPPPTASSQRVSVKPSGYRFVEIADVLSAQAKRTISVSPTSKASGVSLYLAIKGARVEDVQEALASYFSHKGAVSRWDTKDGDSRFVLSSLYDATLDKKHWDRKMIALFDDILKYQNATDAEKEALKDQRSLYGALKSSTAVDCVRLMTGVFDRDTIEKILTGEDTGQAIAINSLDGENRQMAEGIYDRLLSGPKMSPVDNPRLKFSVDWLKKEATGTLWIHSEGKDGPTSRVTRKTGNSTKNSTRQHNEVGRNFLGWFAEEEAEEEMGDFWLVRGDEKIDLIPEAAAEADMDVNKVPIPSGNYWEKFRKVSEHFDLPVIAVLPKSPTTKELRVSTLPQTLRELSKDTEPLLFKKRNGILLVCPASFLSGKGVAVAIPLATVKELLAASGAVKGGGDLSILQYERLTKDLNDAQLENNAIEFSSFSLVLQWRPLLRALLSEDEIARQLESGKEVVIDKRIATSMNRILAILQPNTKSAVGVGDRLLLAQSFDPFPSGVAGLPKDLPEDFLVTRSVIFSGISPNGKVLCRLESHDAIINPKYVNGIPKTEQ